LWLPGDRARLPRAFGRLPAPESLLFAGPKRSNQEKWPGRNPVWGKAGTTSLRLQVLYSQSHCRRYAASARWPRQVKARLATHCEVEALRTMRLIATQSCQLHLACCSPSLAVAPERSRHSGGNDSVSSEPSRQDVIAQALGPDVLTQAFSLGYFSLGQQREVTRAAAAVRKPAAGEPGRESATYATRPKP
jgi:hypothetical protein